MEKDKKYVRTRHIRRRGVVVVLGMVLGFIGFHAPVHAADSDLDSSFGTGGTQLFNFADGNNHSVLAVRYAPDGKIVTCGEYQSVYGALTWFSMARFMPDGSFDTSFNSTGVWRFDFGSGNAANKCTNVIVQPDGKIVAVGSGQGLSFVIRMNADGTQDSTFGTISLGTLVGHSVKLQSDGKILIAGIISDDAAVKRLNADGSTDTSFGVSGLARLVLIPEYNESYQDLVIQPDGKIVLTGFTNNVQDFIGAWTYDAMVIRLNSDGSMDTGFGTNGVVKTYVGNDGQGNSVGSDFAQAATLQPDGKIIIAGYYENGSDLDTFVIRYNTNGTLDSSFGNAGIVTTAMTSYSEKVNGVHLQSDGKVLVTAIADQGPSGQNSSFYSGAVMRLGSDGSRDAGFGTNGFASYPFPQSLHSGFLVESDIGTDGSLLLAAKLGITSNGFGNVLARVMGLSIPQTTTTTTSTTIAATVSSSPTTTATSTTTVTTVANLASQKTLPSTGVMSLPIIITGVASVATGIFVRRRTRLSQLHR